MYHVTGYGKTGLTADLIFHQEHKLHEQLKLLNFTIKIRLEWSAFSGYFSQAQWQGMSSLGS